MPVFNELTGLPPYLGMLAGLSVLWAVTDVLHAGKEGREALRVPHALAKIDTSGILFFLGVLMSIGAIDQAGLLKDLALALDAAFTSLPFAQEIIATVIGLASALIDNVPLVAATMGMYDLGAHPMDDQLWQLIAYCAGTGGSILVIGSSSGVALMGMEKVDCRFLKNASFGAAAGYVGVSHAAQSAVDLPGDRVRARARAPAVRADDGARPAGACVGGGGGFLTVLLPPTSRDTPPSGLIISPGSPARRRPGARHFARRRPGRRPTARSGGGPRGRRALGRGRRPRRARP